MSFRDALIVGAAKVASCAQILSDDLSDGQVLEGVQVVNPFRT